MRVGQIEIVDGWPVPVTGWTAGTCEVGVGLAGSLPVGLRDLLRETSALSLQLDQPAISGWTHPDNADRTRPVPERLLPVPAEVLDAEDFMDLEFWATETHGPGGRLLFVPPDGEWWALNIRDFEALIVCGPHEIVKRSLHSTLNGDAWPAYAPIFGSWLPFSIFYPHLQPLFSAMAGHIAERYGLTGGVPTLG